MPPLPAFVPFPPAKLRNQIVESEWTSFLSAWASLARAYSDLPQDELAVHAARSEVGIEDFLFSFIKHASTVPGRFQRTEQETSLKQACLALILQLSDVEGLKISKLLDTTFLSELCLVYLDSSRIQGVTEKLFLKARHKHGQKILEWKNRLISSLATISGKPKSASLDELTKLVALVKISPSGGSFLMEGSDFLDALTLAWEGSDAVIARKLVVAALYCLSSLLKPETKNTSSLLDHLYSLKVNHEERIRHKKASSLLEQLLGTTPLLSELQMEFNSHAGRGHTLLAELQKVAAASGLQRRRIAPPTSSKGKGKALQNNDEELHMHKMSIVTQVQDLFPELEASYIMQLLDTYNDDAERVIAHLLDNPPPPQSSPEKSSTTQPLPTVSEAMTKLPTLAPHTSQIPTRRNIYDDEDLATLSIDTGRLHIGRRLDQTRLQTPSTTAKAAILSALAAFDSDSDERDDTYDADDVGGTVDTTLADDTSSNDNEETLYLTWKATPALFNRDNSTRHSAARADLRSKTGLTDEAIEGWAIMLSRDPRRQSRLATRFEVFVGQQVVLQSDKWRAPDDKDDEEQEQALDENGRPVGHITDRGRGGRLRGARGRGGRGRGRGTGPSAGVGADGNGNGSSAAAGGPTSANERKRKDASKSSRANHNRRDQRAKKVSRADFPA